MGLLEENLATNLAVALREDSQKHFDGINDALFDMENKLHGIKRLVKKGGDDSDEAGLKNVLERVEGVSRRLETVQGVLETRGTGGGDGQSFDVALVLTEVRKRAEAESLDRHSQDLFKAVHNVQRRLLEEHKRLINRLGELQTPAPDPATLQLYDTLSKVRLVQTELLGKQDVGVGAQEECNRLLKLVVDSLESAKKILSNEGGGLMGGRMAELCDELATAVSGLITAQTKLSENSSFEKLDSLLKSVASTYRSDSGKNSAVSTRGGGKRRGQLRRADSSSPASEPNSFDLEQLEASRFEKQPRQLERQGGEEAEEEINEVPDEVLISPVARRK